jgi:hypothetical protein
MSPEVETFWVSQGLYEDGAFMRYLTPALTVIRQFLDDNAGVARADEAGDPPARYAGPKGGRQVPRAAGDARK